jgi:hypothetical protein
VLSKPRRPHTCQRTRMALRIPAATAPVVDASVPVAALRPASARRGGRRHGAGCRRPAA